MIILCVSIIVLLLPCSLAGVPVDIEVLEKLKLDPLYFAHKDKCYTSLDNECFNNGPPWYDPEVRPFSAPPEECKDVKYLLFTPSSPGKEFQLNKDNIRQSPYSCSLDTKVIVHGFGSSSDGFLPMKDAILNASDCNVIVLDYNKCAKPPYFQAVANIRTVAARTAILIKQLLSECGEDSAQRFHLIGHSNGAHLCGYVGKRIDGVGRITGLDSSRPMIQGLPSECHLDSDDAQYVDVLHTSAAKTDLEGGLGFIDLIGDVDIFVNNGRLQPGCRIDEKFFEALTKVNYTEYLDVAGCSHKRSHKLYTSSILLKNCVNSAVQCKSWEDFQNSKCSPDKNPKVIAGYYSQKPEDMPPKSKFYVRTGDQDPYCVQNSDKPASRRSIWRLLRGSN